MPHPIRTLVLFFASALAPVVAPLLVLLLGTGALAGETPSPGPPWRFDWREAKREASRTGRPIFAYFTKKH